MAALLALPLADVDPPAMLRVAAVTGTLTAYARRIRVGHLPSGLVVEGIAVPLVFLFAALASLPDPESTAGVALALLWTALAAAIAAQAGPTRRDPHAFVAALCGGMALLLALPDDLAVMAPAFAVYGVFLVAAALRLRAPLVLVPAVLSLALATAQGARLLDDRPWYAYVPFLTLPSLVAAVVVGLWIAAGAVAGQEGRRVTLLRDPEVSIGPRLWWGVAAVLAFLWGHEELAHAFSRDIANFLLIAYYAVVGVGAIAIGRRRDEAALRRTGLALAVFADLKAIFTAAQISAVGLRVGSYLLSGFFLLAVGYWAWSSRRDEAPDGAAPRPSGPGGAPSGAR
jgi:hypothetical protein